MKLSLGSREKNENTAAWFGTAIILVIGQMLANYFGQAFFILAIGLAGLWLGYFFLFLPYQRGGGNAITDFFKKSRDQQVILKGEDLKVGTKVQRAYRITPLNQKGIDLVGVFKALRVIDVTMTFSEIWTEEPYHRLKRVLREVLKIAGLEHQRFIVDYLKSIEDFKKSPMNIILLTGTSADVQSAMLRLKGFVRIEQIPWKPPVNIRLKEGKNTLQIRDGPYPSAGGGYFKVLVAQELPGGSLGELIKHLKSARVNLYITPDVFRTDIALTVLDEDRKSRKRKEGKENRSEQADNIADYKQQIIDQLEKSVSAGLILLGTRVIVVVNAGDYDSLKRSVSNLTEWAQIAGFNLMAPDNQASALSNMFSLTQGTLEKESVFTLPVDQVEEALSLMYINADDAFLHGYPIGHDPAGFAVYLSKMGRCLIAGESGSGKSVGTAIMILNTILEKLKRVALIDHVGSGQTKNSFFLAMKRAIDEGYLKAQELTIFDFSDDPKTSSRINIFRVFKDKETQKEFEKDLFSILGRLTKGETKKVMQLRKQCITFSGLVSELEKIKDSDLGDRLGFWDGAPWMFGDDSGPVFEQNQYVSYNLWKMSSMRSKIALVNIVMLIEQIRSSTNPCELYLEEAQDLLPGDETLGSPTIGEIVRSNFRGARKFDMDVGLLVQNPQDLIDRKLYDVLKNLSTALIYSNVSREVYDAIGIENDIDIGKEGMTGVALLWKKRVGSVLVHLGISPMVQKLVLGNLDGFQPPKIEERSNRFFRISDISSERKADLLAQGHQITRSTELVGGEQLQFIHEPVENRENGVLLFLILEEVEKYLGENKYLYDIKILPSGGWIKVSKKGHHIIRLYVPEETDLESVIAKIGSWNGRTVAVTRDRNLEVPNTILHASKIVEAIPGLLGDKNALQD
ncbi:MAG: hypothetical protein ABIG84_02230 [archaeon]